jgi:hypothetical protein
MGGRGSILASRVWCKEGEWEAASRHCRSATSTRDSHLSAWRV